MLQAELDESNAMDIISTLTIGFWSFLAIFCMCEFGEQVTNQFIKFNDELDQCSWYLFPMQLQRMLIIVMINAQQPAVIQGYANAVCTRFAFNKVAHLFRLFSIDTF